MPSHFMSVPAIQTQANKPNPVIRAGWLALGGFLILLSPIVAPLPGPGGIFVFAAGFAMVLRHSNRAKRRYVRFKRTRPKTGRMIDWGLRRASAKRRGAIARPATPGD